MKLRTAVHRKRDTLSANAQDHLSLEDHRAECVRRDQGLKQSQSSRQKTVDAISKRRRDFDRRRSRLSAQEIQKFERDERIFLDSIKLTKTPIERLSSGVLECWVKLVKRTDLFDDEAASVFERVDKKGGGFGVLGLKYWQKPKGQKQSARYFLKVRDKEARESLKQIASPSVLQCLANDQMESCLRTCEEVQGPAGERHRAYACVLGVQQSARLCSDNQDLKACNALCEVEFSTSEEMTLGLQKSVCNMVEVLERKVRHDQNETQRQCKLGKSDACHRHAQALEPKDRPQAFAQFLQACRLGRTGSCSDAQRLKNENLETQKAYAFYGCDNDRGSECQLLSSLLRKEGREKEADAHGRKACTLDSKACDSFAKDTRSRIELKNLCDSRAIGCDRLIADYEKGTLAQSDADAALSYRKKLCLAGTTRQCKNLLAKLERNGQKREARAFRKEICKKDEAICQALRDERRRKRGPFFFYSLGATPSFESNPYATNVSASGGIEDDTTLALFPAAALSLDAEVALRLDVFGENNLKAALKIQSLHMFQIGEPLDIQQGGATLLLGGHIGANLSYRFGRFESATGPSFH